MTFAIGNWVQLYVKPAAKENTFSASILSLKFLLISC